MKTYGDGWAAGFRHLLLALALAGPATSAAAQSEPRGTQPRDPRVDAVFAQWDRPDSPGCALGVYRNGAIIYARGYGMADLERSVPITRRSVFDIGSTSKQFAAASILLLQQQGRLSLDDDVRRHVPELPEYPQPITIRQLLHHTSGLRDYIGLLTLTGARTDDVTTPQDALDIIARQRELNFAPGDEHLYSNSGYFLLSIIVERVAGQSLRDFARERIFEPLGMTRTHYLDSYDDIVPDRALAYSPRAGGGLRGDVSRWLQLGDGAVFTTVEDLLHWDRNFYDPAVGGPAFLEELQTRGRLNDGTTLGYALGLSLGEYRGQRTVSHGGSWGGYRAELIRFPDQRFSVATLCNLGSINPGQLAQRVADVFLADVLAPATASPASSTAAEAEAPAADVPESVLRGLAGTYRNPATRAVRTIVLDGGQLYLTMGGARYPLRPHSATIFQLIGAPARATLSFQAAEPARPHRLTWVVEGQEPVHFERLELVAPSPAELQEYAGTFHSDELRSTFTIVVTDGALTLHRRGAPPQPLRPVVRDEFAVGSMTLRFSRDAAGTVGGYLLDLGRIRNLRFDRTEPQLPRPAR